MTGAFCLVLCGWCVGDGFAARAQAHQNALQRTIELLERIRREIEFRRTDLSILFLTFQREGLVGQADSSMQTLTPYSALTRQEKAVFQECISMLGHAEAPQECQRLNLYIEQFRAFQERSRPALQTTQELSHKIGLALGLAAAVLLL